MPKRVKNMSRRQQMAVMSKIRPSYVSKSSAKSDIKRIHRDSGSSDQAKSNYNVYRSEMINHLDKTEVKQYRKNKKREDRAVRKTEKQERQEEKQRQKEKQIEKDNQSQDKTNSNNVVSQDEGD